jgi:hypothetical protein
MQDGVKEYCWPMNLTVTAPSGSSALPRLDELPAEMQGPRVGGLDAALRHRPMI